MITDFKQKADIFNTYFAEQCQTWEGDTELPNFIHKTNNRLPTVEFSVSDILYIIKGLDSNKAHGNDGISVKMIKICGKSLTIPLAIIFRNCISSGVFPATWKQANVVPVHKKSSKQLVNNYRPISLLPIISKIFEKIIFNNLYQYFHNNNFE